MSADLWKKRKQLWQPPHFWGFKVCAVLCAILLWFYVMETQNPMTEESFTVPVEMRNLSSSLAIPDTNRQVTIRVQGRDVYKRQRLDRTWRFRPVPLRLRIRRNPPNCLRMCASGISPNWNSM